MSQTSNKAIPRYIVQFSEGERELDALEMVRLYGGRFRERCRGDNTDIVFLLERTQP